ncbi:antibiotic biosynthesis monooxygenase [Allostreptomyces psammosilenae]|uniref:Antibiotic biosynthesis monooxygenase n=1 Tax=Allostreptomyces psammosilenae TaxID=1892865 RepID=A0A852ZZQ0_9ACTN|nr:antibiotic biosynthesis monooxygenase [Allostreptomyces psammosilenae]NYI06700.1 hypothetical protein [Allostreptomyces psammosilenae]
MTTRQHSLPDITRSDAGTTMISTWSVGTPERQRAAVDAITTVWEREPWPTPDLLSYSVFAGTDGDTMLHYSQWTGEDAYHRFVRSGRQPRNDEIDAAVPGIHRVEIAAYRRYRSLRLADRPAVPGCVVVVDVRFDGPDERRQRDWADAVCETLARQTPNPDRLSAHLHLSTDGTRVIDYAEWTSERAHIEAAGARGGLTDPEWERLRDFPGLSRNACRTRRYRFERNFTRP